jgi:hypothetical protein
MSQRESGYERKPFDQYETPAWVTLALIPQLPAFTGKIWEPACGSGKMVAALRQAGFDVVASDITQGVDFLDDPPELGVSAIITNPPYALACEFIERALYIAGNRIDARRIAAQLSRNAHSTPKPSNIPVRVLLPSSEKLLDCVRTPLTTLVVLPDSENLNPPQTTPALP